MAQKLVIHTGNILQLADLKRKPGHTPADELHDSLKIQLSKAAINGHGEIHAPLELSAHLNPEERVQQKITVKIFLTAVNKDFVKDALNAALLELGAKRADLCILSWPAGISLDQGKDLWSTLEDLVDKDQVYSLGVSDIETQDFVQLHGSSRVKPEAIQVNLETCCVVPPELVTFTRENNIQLLTHNDPQNILPAETLKTVISSLTEIHWIVRYQTLLRCRGIIQNKGYVIDASVSS